MSDRYDPATAEGPIEAQRKKSKKRKPTEVRVVQLWLRYTLPQILGVLAAVWLVLLVHSAWPERGEYEGRVLSSNGQAFVRPLGTRAVYESENYTAVWPGRPLLARDTLATGEQSTLTVALAGTAALHLPAGTQVGLDNLSYDRQTGSRLKAVRLYGGSLFVRSGTAAGPQPHFNVRAATRTVSGFGALYWVMFDRVCVWSGAVGTSLGREVPAGQTLLFDSGQVRALTSEEGRALQAAAAAMGEVGWEDKAKQAVTDFELGVILARTSGILRTFGHESGDGNPFARFSVVNSSRRTQALKRAQDLVQAMTAGGNPPDHVRLDDLKALGVDDERLDLCRQAFYRGQLMSYQSSDGGQAFTLYVRANDKKKTLIKGDQNGASVVPD
jgi:hypothetical protein